jgi:hypothetical protein
VLVGASLNGARGSWENKPEIYERIPARDAVDDDGVYAIGGDDWDAVSDCFDDVCKWDEREVPLRRYLRYSRPFWLSVTRSAGSTRMSLLGLATCSGCPVWSSMTELPAQVSFA